MLYHAVKAGVVTLREGLLEILRSMRRAGIVLFIIYLFQTIKTVFHTLGGDVIITYYTPEILKWLKEASPL